MANFSDILITTDYDRTLTAPDATIPKNNLDAINHFIENGGTFTVNTGRTVPSATSLMESFPVNAPFLLYNGAAAYDKEKGSFLFAHEIQLVWAETYHKIREKYPSLWIEYQGAKAHFLFREHPVWPSFCKHNHYSWNYAKLEDELGPFLKFCVYYKITDITIDHLFHGTQEEIAFMDEVESWLNEEFGGKCVITRGADLYIDIQPIGVSKGRSARELKQQLGKKILVCIGDAENDLSMLDDADHAFCPADAIIKDRYENVCPCAEGAVADVIYHKIPNL